MWDKKQFSRWKRLVGFDLLYVIDIDNTLTISNLGDPIDHINPIPRKGLIDYVKGNIDKGTKVVYLSARDFRLYKQTETWLSNNEIYNSIEQELYLVKSSFSKISYLETIVKANQKVVFIDDLSYNYENNDVKYYDETKEALSELEVDYMGIEFISKFV